MTFWWQALSFRMRTSLAVGVAVVLLSVSVGAWWLWRPEPAVLFSDLRPQDAAALGAELEKLKIPYEVADEGGTLLVERSQVPTVRMKLMGRDLPLQGSVGLELFNTTDFGMTEFAQKVNFQRALQGELTRTILSFPEVRSARVHLVLPEQGLFKQNAGRAKAAITLALRSGHTLRPEQVVGIQRLVAAAVPGLAAQEVTIVDQQGVALNRTSEAESEAASGSSRLELKRATEAYLTRKAMAVLDQAFGPGEALASVDVTLNMDQVRVTTEDVIPASDGKAGAAAGVLVRERESARDNAGADARAARGSSMQRDVEYQPGRRVEHVVSQPGTIRRIQAVAVVRQDLDPDRQEQLRKVLGAAVGANAERGDSVVLQLLQPRAVSAVQPGTSLVPTRPAAVAPTRDVAWAAASALPLLAIAWLAWRRRPSRAQPQLALTDEQRRAALQRVQAWMADPGAETASVRSPRGGGLE